MQELDGSWIAEASGMKGVRHFGDTKEAAIGACKALARIVYLEEIGALTILEISDRRVSVLAK